MDDKIFDAVNTLMQDFMQRFADQLSDMMNGVPAALLPVAMAMMQAMVNSLLECIPENAREVYDACLNSIVLVSLPPDLDPRKNKED